MAKNSQIEWTHHTFNPWWGCSKVSPACEHCYAELWAKRVGHRIWGRAAARRFFADSHWSEPLGWNTEAQASGQRQRVFCASMADIFEKRAELNGPRGRLWTLIEETPWLDWLLLTKRPQNITAMVPWKSVWPVNAWLGTTVENQTLAETRLPHLLKHAAAVRFLSCEPLLGKVDLARWFRRTGFHAIDWVIAGGESGPNARPMHPDWASTLLHQCREADVPFHFKQWGHWVPFEMIEGTSVPRPTLFAFPSARPVRMVRLAKHEAGRVLEGGTWDEFPRPRLCHAKS